MNRPNRPDLPNEWPTIPVVVPDPNLSYETGVLSLRRKKNVDDLLDFYRETLVPQLACAPDGDLDPYPARGWLTSFQQPKTVVVARQDGVLHGAWIIKNADGQISYPVSVLQNIAGVFRALWDETITHFDYVWGDTRNPVIMAFAQKAVRVPPRPTTPTVNDRRLEWRKPQT